MTHSAAAEEWLLSRLKNEGVDIYVDKRFDSLRDRLASAIVTYRLQSTRAGQRNREPESFESVFERIYQVRLADCVSHESQLFTRARGSRR